MAEAPNVYAEILTANNALSGAILRKEGIDATSTIGITNVTNEYIDKKNKALKAQADWIATVTGDDLQKAQARYQQMNTEVQGGQNVLSSIMQQMQTATQKNATVLNQINSVSSMLLNLFGQMITATKMQ